ncbi:MAG: hypothetical protein QXJ28_01835, partial [Candidatus Pacearchaeota archaeon]
MVNKRSFLIISFLIIIGINLANGTSNYLIVNIDDTPIQTNVSRFGINLGSIDESEASSRMLKNIFVNPGLESGVYRSIIALEGTSSSGNTVKQRLDHWNTSWNSDTWLIGWPEGFWNDADYEIVYGPANGTKGKIINFYHSENQNTFELDKVIPEINDYDIMIIRKNIDSYGRIECGKCIYDEYWNCIGYISCEIDNSSIRPNSRGSQSLVIPPEARLCEFFDSADRDGDSTANKLMIIQGNWTINFWAKSNSSSNSIWIQFERIGEYSFLSTTTSANNSWRLFNYSLNVPVGADNISNTNAQPIQICINNQGSNPVWIDDIEVRSLDDRNPTVFSDLVVYRLKEYRPGVIRSWQGQLASSLYELVATEFERGTSGYSPAKRKPTNFIYSMNEFFELCYEVGADPWFVIPPTLNESELVELIDFISGPNTTKYGEIRSNLGYPDPWTNKFNKIYLEFGNEMWGCGGSFNGAEVCGGGRLGSIANDRFSIMKTNPNFNSSKIKLIIGGQAGSPEGYTQQLIELNSNNHDVVAIAPYYDNMSNFSSDNLLYSSFYARAMQEALDTWTNKSFTWITGNEYGESHDFAIYELNFHTTNLGNPPEDVRNKIMTSIGGGITLAHHMLIYLKHFNARIQAPFQFLQYSYKYQESWQSGDGQAKYARIWGLLRDLDGIRTKRPTWLSVEIANKGIFGNMITTQNTGNVTYWLQPAINGINEQREYPHINTFAFKNDTTYSLIIFNFHLNQSKEIMINISKNVSSIAYLYQLNSSNISDNNEVGQVVNISEIIITNFVRNYTFSVPPFSENLLIFTINFSLPSGGASTNNQQNSGSSGGGGITYKEDEEIIEKVKKPTLIVQIPEEKLSKPYLLEVYNKSFINLTILNKTYFIIINSINKSEIRFIISSEVQENSLFVGEEMMRELSGDDYYDLRIKLVSIEIKEDI